MAATIPRAALDFLTEEINGISADAQARVLKVLQGINWTPENVAQCRELVMQALAAVMPTYTTMAAQASADFYDAARELVVGERLGAQAISDFDMRKTEGAVRGFVRFVLRDDVQTFNEQVLQRIDYEMKRSANMSVVENGRRDPKRVRYARVPTGAETCDFCLMLASRGFVYQSEGTAGAGHTHYACDCRCVPGWSGMEVEGYDPGSIYDVWQERIHEMADERAERHGTSEKEELAKIMSGYAEAARNAKRRSRTA